MATPIEPKVIVRRSLICALSSFPPIHFGFKRGGLLTEIDQKLKKKRFQYECCG